MEPIHILTIQKPRFRKKLAMFDFDWTLVKPLDGRRFPKNVDDWQWLQPNVPDVLRSYYQKGFAIVIFTNQSKPWKAEQIHAALTSLAIPCTAAIAFDKSKHKPHRDMFDMFLNGRNWDPKASFFVGDALGRAADFADSDKVFAETIGVRVLAPEDLFPFPKSTTASQPSKIKNPKIQPVSHQEMVIMVGYPGSGKSTVAAKLGQDDPLRYIVIDGDLVKTVPKMLSMAKAALQDGKSVVFDATNGTKERRAKYIELAKEFNIHVRCIHVATSMEEAVARNNARPKEKGVPMIAYYTYRKRFEEPTADECELITI